MGDRETVRVEVLGTVAHPAEILEDRLRERLDHARKLGRDRILDSHVRSLSSGGAKPLTQQQRLRGHPIRVIRGNKGTLDIATAKTGRRRNEASLGPVEQPASCLADTLSRNLLQSSMGHQILNR